MWIKVGGIVWYRVITRELVDIVQFLLRKTTSVGVVSFFEKEKRVSLTLTFSSHSFGGCGSYELSELNIN